MNELYPQVRLIDICDQERGIRYGILKVGNFSADGIPVIRGGDIKSGKVSYDNNKKVAQEISDQFKRTILHGGEIVINLIGGAGHSAVVPKEYKGFNVTRDVAVIPLEDSVETRFIDFYLRSAGVIEWMRQRLQGSVTQKINLETLRDAPVYLPPIYEQKAIAHILGTLDDKIELNHKTSETLEAMAKALFKSWFVDFDPVRAKAEGRPTGLPAEISDLFPDSFEDSELGEIPSGWAMETLGEIVDVDKGVSYKGDFLSDAEGLPMVNLGCFAGGGAFRAEKMKFYAGEYRERHLASAGDLLVANTDMTQNRIILGAPIVVPSWRGRDKFLFSHHTFAIRFRRSKSTFTRFIYFTLLKPSFRQVAAGHATGTTVLALPKDGITDYQTVIPPAGLLNVFAAKVEALYQKCHALTEQCELLAKTRDALLPKLISGEIRIPDAERMLEEVGV
jgi:type I restriction enzyme S subunit